MINMTTVETHESIVQYDDSQQAKERVFAIVLKHFLDTEHFTGEQIAQCDATYERAPDLLADLADNGFKFQAKWKPEDE